MTDGIRTSAFVRGSDGAVWRRDADATGHLSSWLRLGGVLSPGTGAGVARTGPGAHFVLVHGVDGAMWVRRLAPGSDSGWSTLGGRLIGDPAAVSVLPGRVDVFARGADDGLWRRWSTGRGWSGWVGMGGRLSSAPTAAASTATLRTDVFVRGIDARLYSKSSATGWASWSAVP